MLAKNTRLKVVAPISISPARYRKELEALYARRVALTSLIQSLEDYDRFRSKRFEGPVGQKTA